MKIDYDMEFVSLRDFLELPFFIQSSKVVVSNEDIDKIVIDAITIKDLKIEIADGMYQEYVEDYYVDCLIPSLIVHDHSRLNDDYIFRIELRKL